MKKIIKIVTEHGELKGELNDRNPKTVKEILKILPVEGEVNRWGDEIYFEIPLSLNEENAQEEVEVGDIAYWPPGNALCIFFGKTPASTNDKPKAYSPVNVIGKILGKVEILKKVKDGEKIRILKE
ncbi:MAG: cyclophilin-like fold protein [Candidatus Aenigmatarchaeota archaeon]|jgi:hypothetical protein